MGLLKFYDTNALLTLGESVFDDDNFYISSVSLHELEHIKTDKNKTEDVKFKARRMSRLLDENRDKFVVVHYTDTLSNMLGNYNLLYEDDNPDIRICVSAKSVDPVIFVSDDICCKNIARNVFGLQVESAKQKTENIYKGYTILEGSTDYINEKMSDLNYKATLYNNEYICIKNTDDGSESEMKFLNGEFLPLKLPPSKYVKGKNALQRCALDILNNPNITIAAILGGYGSGKAQPNDTLIPTPNGYVHLGDIKVGDYVFDANGNPTKVLGVYPKGLRDNYKVTFADGRCTYCNDEHLWSYITSKGNLKTVELKEMISTGIHTHNGKQYRYYIPINDAVKYDTKSLSVDPYIMGYSIGNGCLLEKPFTISTDEADIVDIFMHKLNAADYYHIPQNYSYSFYKKDEAGNKTNYKVQTKDLFRDYPEIMVKAKDKHIPSIYKFGDMDQRMELLRGLLDSDGHIDERGRLSYSTISSTLANDVQELCYSLGFSASLSLDTREKYESGCSYVVIITCPPFIKPNLFKSQRKKSIATNYIKNINIDVYRKRNSISIRNIEKLNEKVEMTCIYVDNPDHLYLTNDYIVTHNTHLAMRMGLYWMNEKGTIDKLLGVRSPEGEGKEVGFLPGDLEDKTDKFFLPLEQQLEGGEFELASLKQQDKLESTIPFYMKGTTYNHTVILCDEAEDLTKKEIKLVGTRVGEGSRIFFSGDYKQSVVNSTTNNALVEMCNEFKGRPEFACIYLDEDVRSTTSKLFADLFDKES